MTGPRPERISLLEQELLDLEQQPRQRLERAARVTQDKDPRQASRVLTQQRRTGLAPDLVERRLQQLEAQGSFPTGEIDEINRAAPTTRDWLSEDPNRFAAARTDLRRLSYLERQIRFAGDQMRTGRATVRMSELGQRWAVNGRLSDAEQRELTRLEREVQGRPSAGDYGITGFLEGIPAALLNQLPIFANTAAHTGLGAFAGAGVGAIAMNPITVVAGAGIGARLGAGVGAARMEGGLAYLEFARMKDESGKPLDRETALGAAFVVGMANGAMESLSFGVMAKTIPGLRQLTREGIKQQLQQTTRGQLMKRSLKNVGQGMATEGLTEFLQNRSTHFWGELARLEQDGTAKTLSAPELIDRLFVEGWQGAVQEARAGAQASGGMTAVGSAISAPIDLRRQRAQNAQARILQALGETKDSELVKSLPIEAQELINRMTQDGPIEKLFVPLDVWNDYWGKQEVDPGEMAEAVFGDRVDYDEATRTGKDLAIPTSRYSVALAPTDHHAFFSEEIRTGEARLSARELREMQETAAKEADATTDEEAKPDLAAPIRDRVREQLVATGRYDDETAETAATIWSEFFRVQAQDLGIDPSVLFDRFGARIMTGAGVPAMGEPLTQEPAKEYIHKAAIRRPGGQVYEGTVHDDALEAYLGELGIDAFDYVENMASFDDKVEKTERGYTTTTGRFVTDKEADDILIALGVMTESERGVIDAEDVNYFNRQAQGLEQAGKKAKKIPEILPGFHSKAERLIETKFPVRGTVAVARNILKDVKEEERIWIGLDRLLADFEDATGAEGLLDRETLLAALRASRVKLTVESTQLGGNGQLTYEQIAQRARMTVNDEYDLVEINGKWYAVDLNNYSSGVPFATMDGTDRTLVYNDIDNGQLVPYATRAEAFREAVKEQSENIEDDQDEEFGDEFDDSGDFEQYTLPGGEDYRIFKFVLPSIRPTFDEGHFETENVVVHVRTKNRVTADGRKTLFIEEIQSDWHQKGRDRGYLDSAALKATQKEYRKLIKEVKSRADEIARAAGLRRNRKQKFIEGLSDGSEGHELDYARSQANTVERNDWDNEIAADRRLDESKVRVALKRVLGKEKARRIGELGEQLRSGSDIAAAPFKNTWHELALKRMLRLATDEGFDSISWTTGQQQIERYNLRTNVSEIKITGKIGEDAFKYSTKTGERAWTNEGEHSLSELHNLFGPELAATIRAGFEEGNYKQEYAAQGPYAVGGYGMEAFYDGMLARFLSQFGKRYEAAPSRTMIPIEHSEAQTAEQAFNGGDAAFAEVHELRLTPALKQAAAQSDFALFQDPAPRVLALPPGFHSRAERLIEEKLPMRATVQNVRDILAGAKKEELEWLGIDNLLQGFEEAAGPDGLLDRDFVLAHLRASRLEIVEVGGWTVAMENDEDIWTLIHDRASEIFDEYWFVVTVEDDDQGSYYAVRAPADFDVGGEFRYIQNSTQEGVAYVISADYFEEISKDPRGFVVMRGRTVEGATEAALEKIVDDESQDSWDTYVEFVRGRRGTDSQANNSMGDVYESYTLPGGSNYRSILFTLPSDRFLPRYRTNHWDKSPNVFAWVRLKDRIDADGRMVLFVEELQSDWHQQGRAKGYRAEFQPISEPYFFEQSPEGAVILWQPNRYHNVNGDIRSHTMWGNGTTITEVLEKYTRSTGLTLDESQMPTFASDEVANRLAGVNTNRTRVPNAPFKNTWREFAMKRVIRMAAEGGYDAIAWTTGDQQADRWNLSQSVRRITWGQSAATGENPEDRVWDLTVDFHASNTSRGKLIDDSDLVDYVGPELAAKMRASTDPNDTGVFEDDDLKVGGHGHRVFYDEILVNFANSFGKKFKAKVEDGTMVTPTYKPTPDITHPAHQLTLTPELKAAALADAFALYQSPAEIRRLRHAAREEIQSALREHETFLEIMNDTARGEEARTMTADERVELAGDMTTLMTQIKFEASLLDMLEQGDVRAAYHLLAIQPEFLADFSANLPNAYRWIVESMGFQQGSSDISAWVVRNGKVTLNSATGDGAVTAETMLDRDTPVDGQSETAKKAWQRLLEVTGSTGLPRFEPKGEDVIEMAGNPKAVRELLSPTQVQAIETKFGASYEDLYSGTLAADPVQAAQVWAQRLVLVQLGIEATYKNDIRYLVSRNVIPGEQPWRVSIFAGVVPMGHFGFESKERAEESMRNRGAEPLPDVFQGEEDTGGPRGRISWSETGVNIELLEKADLSTFLHETGHLYLEILRSLAPESARAKRDLDILLDYLGVEDATQIDREHHELFARSFEAYLREGRAPVPALQAAFSRIRAWMLEIYRTIVSLDVNLTDEVRGVFDRMLASDQALREAEAERGAEALFKDPAAFGMSEAEAERYADAIAAARAAAEEELTQKLMDDVRRERSRQWKLARERIRQEIAAEVNDDPIWRALAVLQRGTLPDGTPLPPELRAIKLDRAAIVAMYDGDEDVLGSLPRPFIYAKVGGIHPDLAAEMLGFSSGDALLKALPGRGSPTPEQHIDTLTDERMRAEHPDLMVEGLAEAAAEALHSDRRAELLRRELQHLASQDLATFKNLVRAVSRPVPTIAEVRQIAQQLIAGRRVRDVKPDTYRRAESKAAKAAVEALMRGDIAGAFAEKQRELLNHELYRAATEAHRQVEKILAHARSFDRPGIRERLTRAGHTYLANIDQILERFEFRRVSLKALAKRESLLDFQNEIKEQGLDIYIPEEVLADAYRENYKNLTLDQLVGIDETLRQIAHLARVKNKLLAAADKRSFEEAKAEIRGSIAANHEIKSEPLNFVPGFADRMKQKVRGIIAAHQKMEFLFEWLDGNKDTGPVWRRLFKPLADAEAAENAMMRDAVIRIDELFSVYPRGERATWFYRKIEVPGFTTAFTKSTLLAVALNQGNAYNKEALLEGYGWTQEQVDVLLAQLTETDWQLVQGIWDLLESYWPAIADLERDLSGLPPAKVESIPVVTPFGTLRGGYYPIDFDPERSFRQQALQSREAVQDMFGGMFARAMTKHGHTQARKGTGGKPLRLDLTPVANHVAQVVHDLTHRRAIIDVNRLARDKDIQRDIEGVVGREMYRQIHPWLVNIARPERGNYLNPLEGILGSARASGTVVSLGLKMTTAVTQFLGYTGSIKELGPKYAARGLHDVYSRPGKLLETYRFVSERSEFMKERLSNYDRDVRDSLKRLNVAGAKPGPLSVVGAYAHPLTSKYFYMIGLMDMGASLPTWMGGYRKALDGAVDGIDAGDEAAAIDYADKVVRQTQGVGNAKDLATVQRGPEIFKLFTMFYSYFSVLFNQFAKTQRQLSLDKDYGRYLGALTMLWFLPAVLAEFIVGDPPDLDDEPEDWVKWFLKVQLTYPAASIILLRDIVSGMKFHSYSPSAAFDAYESLAGVGKDVVGLITGDKEELTRGDVREAVTAVGYATKMPSRQVWTTTEYLHDWLISKEQEPANLGEGIWRTLVTGKPREDR